MESAIPTKDSALSNNNADTTGDKTQGAESVEDSTEDSTEDTSEPKEDTAKADGSGFTYILMGIAAVAVIGVVYVVKSKKKKETSLMRMKMRTSLTRTTIMMTRKKPSRIPTKHS